MSAGGPLFDAALARVLDVEKLYSNRSSDPGGETVWGVARRKWPGWGGWAIVDAARGPGFPQSLAAGPRAVELSAMVADFYLREFWRACSCDELAAVDEVLAVKVFDTAVNLGGEVAAELLQGCLRTAGRRNVAADGQIGPETLAAVRVLPPAVLLASFRAAQRAYYLGLMRANSGLRENRGGWLRRAES